MICFPNAKINIGLNIIGKRSDGFHNIQSIIYPISLCDALEIIEIKDEKKICLNKISDKIFYSSSGVSIPGDNASNLCVKAYELVSDKFKLPKVAIHLHKLVPIGGGLGGGSSNAAYTIKQLNNLFELNISDDLMEDLASQLGSDCNFFIKNKPVYVYERGSKYKAVSLDLSGYYVFIVYPRIHISTAEAYKKVKITEEVNLIDMIKLPVEEWKYNIFNSFEDNIFKEYPLIKSIKDQLYSQGAVYASMSGSGSCVYGIFKDNVSSLTSFFPYYYVWSAKL